MTLGPFDAPDNPENARAAVEAAAEPAARLRSQRPPPIWVDRPRGSVLGALVLAALTIPCALLVLYDVGLLWPAPLLSAPGAVVRVQPFDAYSDDYYVQVRSEAGIIVGTFAVRVPRAAPVAGQPLSIVTQRRYGQPWLRAILDANSGKLLYEEPSGITINGAIGATAALAPGAAAGIQLRVARRARSRQQAWERQHLER